MTRRKPKASPEFRNPLRRWALDVALQRYYERWLLARDHITEQCIADILGHAREHTAIVQVPPRHAGTMSILRAYDGIDRSVSPTSLQWARPQEPFSIETLRAATLKIISMVPAPPTRPWLFRHRFEQLVAEGIPAELIKRHFDIT